MYTIIYFRFTCRRSFYSIQFLSGKNVSKICGSFLFVILKVTSTNANVSQEIIRAANFQFIKAPSLGQTKLETDVIRILSSASDIDAGTV